MREAARAWTWWWSVPVTPASRPRWPPAALGCEVALVTTSRATIGHMPCNPAIGGTAKGHLVREIDALGGVMGQAIDATGIQFKLLNRSRGPAVWSPRAQADKILYSQWVTERLEAQRRARPGLRPGGGHRDRRRRVGRLAEGRRETALRRRGRHHGTFLNGLTHVGDVSKPEGRYGEAPSTELAACLRRINLQTGRLKTGTPPRLDRRSIDFEGSVRAARFTEEHGDEVAGRRFRSRRRRRWRTGSSAGRCTPPSATHDVVRRNIDDSPLYNGRITGVGPRYCPSLEDKVMRFPHRERHQLHLEPEGLESESIYVNGLSMSLPAIGADCRRAVSARARRQQGHSTWIRCGVRLRPADWADARAGEPAGTRASSWPGR